MKGNKMKRSDIMLMGMVALGAALAVDAALAGPDKVGFPEGYTTTFVRYATVDKPERDPPIVRFFYVNPDALAAASPGKPAARGTVLIMEDHKAELDANDKAITDRNGRFIPTDAITNVFVQEKGEGWGAEYPPETRNGEWEYAWFEADGSRKVGDFVKFDGCRECHAGVSDQDFNFTFAPFVAKVKGGS